MTDEQYMHRCLDLAQKAKGHTAPNPMVGALLVYNNQIIGEGYHKIYGNAHAEVNCIESVSAANKHLISKSTMYVSLEPCAHHGKTPPCANRIVSEGIRKVVIANDDPFEKVSGRGIQILQDSGIQVTRHILDKEAKWLNRRFFSYHQNKRPYIILKWAETADRYIAPADRSRYQITNSLSNRLVHKWRTEESGIMVGTHTAELDNPQLTARHWPGKNPIRVVLDKSLRLQAGLNIYNASADSLIINEKKEAQQGNVHFIQLPFDQRLLHSIMQKCYERGMLSIIVEGGQMLLNSFIDDGLWDEARVFTVNKVLGMGIPAPVLVNAKRISQTKIDKDLLQVFTNKNSLYPYQQGMEI